MKLYFLDTHYNFSTVCNVRGNFSFQGIVSASGLAEQKGFFWVAQLELPWFNDLKNDVLEKKLGPVERYLSPKLHLSQQHNLGKKIGLTTSFLSWSNYQRFFFYRFFHTITPWCHNCHKIKATVELLIRRSK